MTGRHWRDAGDEKKGGLKGSAEAAKFRRRALLVATTSLTHSGNGRLILAQKNGLMIAISLKVDQKSTEHSGSHLNI